MVYVEALDTISSLTGIPLFVIIIAGIWSLVWDGIALWKAAKKQSLIWFIVLLITNTLGILEILYVYVFSELDFENKKQKSKKSKPVKKVKTTKPKSKKKSSRKFPRLD